MKIYCHTTFSNDKTEKHAIFKQSYTLYEKTWYELDQLYHNNIELFKINDKFISREKINKYFWTQEEFREKQINKIL